MGKEELKSKLKELQAQFKANSKDAHFAQTLWDEIMSVKGQLDVEPSLVHIAIDDIVSELEGDTFTMAVTKNGDAVYHVKGGYTIIADGCRMVSLAETIKGYIEHKNIVETLDEADRELYDLDLSATSYVLNVPMFAFSDPELKYDIATICIQHLRKVYDEAMNAPLQDETPEENKAFEDATLALETLKDELKKED